MPHNEEKRTLSRRDALKSLAAITGAVTLASLPSKWQTPVVEVGALPVHAQGTGAAVIVTNNANGIIQVQLFFAGPLRAAGVAGTAEISKGDSKSFTGLEAGSYEVLASGGDCGRNDFMSSGPVVNPSTFELPAGGTQKVLVTCPEPEPS